MNLISIERDWVVVVAESSQCGLDVLNSQMRRIDLLCKLVGPLAIALVDGYSTIIAIGVVTGMNASSTPIEYFAIAKVYHMLPALRERSDVSDHTNSDPNGAAAVPAKRRLGLLCVAQIRSIYNVVSSYTSHPVFPPSMALCLLYLTVLSFSGQMVTYLISVDFSSVQIGVWRTLSTAIEISATWLAPIAMKKVGPLRGGLWFINWQILCLVGALGCFWAIRTASIAALGLVIGVITSRVGLWGFDLCVQNIIQEVGAVGMHSAQSYANAQHLFRESRLMQEDLSRLLKLLFRTSSSSARMQLQSLSLVPSNSSIRWQ